MLGDQDLAKGEIRSIHATIKKIIKEIKSSKELLVEELYTSQQKITLPLFEIEPSPISEKEKYESMNSFFGNLS